MTARPGSRRIHWLVLAFVVAGALIVGTRSSGPTSREDQVQAIAQTIKCPECSGQSVASSGSRSSKAIRADIAARLERGQSADQIRDFYAGRYGEAILLTPARSGAASLVWILPVVVLIVAAAGLAAAFVRWRGSGAAPATDEDRALVAAAMADPHGEGSGPVSTASSPDRLAALEEERDFLLRSIADLDAEHEAGDIDEADFRALTDDYTARTAEVLRAIDEHREAVEETRRPRSPGRVAAVIAGVAVVAVLAGVLVAQASGRREPGQTITGDAPRTASRSAASRCLELTSAGKAGEAIRCYQAVLKDDPGNPTAMTYFGWTLYLASDGLTGKTKTDAVGAARNLLDRAVDAAPDFADPYAFRAIIAFRAGDVEAAAADLDRVEALDPPASVKQLIRSLRDEVDVAQRTTTTTSP